MVNIGSSAPDSTWQKAWEHRAAVVDGSTLALSSLHGKIVVLLLADTDS